MPFTISKPDAISGAAGIAVGLISWLVFLPGLPVVCFFIGLMVFGLTQKALTQKALTPKVATPPKPDDAP